MVLSTKNGDMYIGETKIMSKAVSNKANLKQAKILTDIDNANNAEMQNMLKHLVMTPDNGVVTMGFAIVATFNKLLGNTNDEAHEKVANDIIKKANAVLALSDVTAILKAQN